MALAGLASLFWPVSNRPIMTGLPFLLCTTPPPSILSAWPPAPQRATATASQCEGQPSLELLPPLSFPSGSTFTHLPPCAWRCAWRAPAAGRRGRGGSCAGGAPQPPDVPGTAGAGGVVRLPGRPQTPATRTTSLTSSTACPPLPRHLLLLLRLGRHVARAATRGHCCRHGEKLTFDPSPHQQPLDESTKTTHTVHW
jgi:hypothetical protein